MSNRCFENPVKKRLCTKGKAFGAWIHGGGAVSSEIMANAGFDFIVIDMEHSPVDVSGLPDMIRATKGTNCLPFVRAPWNDMVVLKRILDCGAYGVHIPFVNTKEEAEYAVRACKYPLKGIRGTAGCTRVAEFGFKRAEYLSNADAEILVMIAIETAEGAANLDDILQVDGLDGIFIGPVDLNASMGYLNEASQETQAVIEQIEKKVAASGKFLGSIAGSVQDAQRMFERGYNYLVVMSDMVELAKLAKQLVGMLQESLEAEK